MADEGVLDSLLEVLEAGKDILESSSEVLETGKEVLQTGKEVLDVGKAGSSSYQDQKQERQKATGGKQNWMITTIM